MYTELCVYLGAGRFIIIISVHFCDNQVSKYGAKYDDKLMHTTIVLHESVENQQGLYPTTYIQFQDLWFIINIISISLC